MGYHRKCKQADTKMSLHAREAAKEGSAKYKLAKPLIGVNYA
ncbi:hypothetical protein COLO4_27667 [Corchorus olitorius]|uniref:Uncharacterized protein n=1 Tax=Corchorus olitorius TaxID=93759 RepID=A0A1R3HQD2_9ROSI|nr:hypothetical protein COLO4_27667 [Corchorus olitorius]